MNIEDKIVGLNELEKYVEKQKALNNKMVLCQGHFNVIHPGHLRFLEFAKEQGNCLIVAIQGYNWLEEKNKSIFFDAEERARGVAALFKVDKVTIFNEISILDVIKTIKPDIYVKGEEFSNKQDTHDEIKLVESNNGKVIFSSGQIEYNSPDLLEHDLIDLSEKNKNLLKNAVKKQNVNFDKLNLYCNSFKDLNVLVIGDTIVDEYIACDAVGMSAEAPVLNIRELENKSYVGGAAVVARHVKALGANSFFISVIGNDEPGKFVKNELEKDGIKTELVVDDSRKTTFKIRYIVGKQKILRVSRLHEHYISQKIETHILKYIESLAKNLDGIIVSDFVYGVVTPSLIESIFKIAKENNIKLFGDSQSSSQIGDINKYIEFDLITPTEREARIALGDKYNGLEKLAMTLLEKNRVKNLIITLADEGFISYQNLNGSQEILIKNQHFPALTVNPLDVMGAGDSLLTGVSLSLCAGANLMEASVIGAGIASIAVSKIGNIPVTQDELSKWLNELSWIN